MTRAILTILLSITFLYSCSDDNPIVIYDIDEEFILRMSEDFNANGNGLQLQLKTLSTYRCDEAQIHHFVQREEEVIRLVISQLFVPENCTEGVERQVTTNIPLGVLAVGDYDIIIQLGNNVENTGQLQVRTDQYQLEMETLVGLDIYTSQLNKVPDNFLWGYFRVSNSTDLVLAEELQQRLYNNGVSAVTVEPGQYSNVIIDENGVAIPDFWEMPTEVTNYPYLTTFYFQTDTPDAVWLSDMLSSFNEEYMDTIPYSYYFQTSIGEEFIQ